MITLITRMRLVIRLRRRTLNHALNRLLNRIPITSIDLQQPNLVVIGNPLQGLEALLIVNERDRHSDPSEATGTAYSMEVGLRVGIAAAVVGDILEREKECMLGGVGKRGVEIWKTGQTDVVDHHRHGLDVDAAGQDIGG